MIAQPEIRLLLPSVAARMLGISHQRLLQLRTLGQHIGGHLVVRSVAEVSPPNCLSSQANPRLKLDEKWPLSASKATSMCPPKLWLGV